MMILPGRAIRSLPFETPTLKPSRGSPASGGVDEIDHVDDDAGAAVIHDRVSIHIAAVAIGGRRRQSLDHHRREWAKTLFPSSRKLTGPVILFAKTWWQVDWAAIVLAEVGGVFMPKVNAPVTASALMLVITLVILPTATAPAVLVIVILGN
jgi:hypothetical protein